MKRKLLARKVSVIITTYNSSSTIEACLDSVFNQKDIEDIEVIVVDDNSNDINKLKNIIKKYDGICLHINEGKKNANVSRNFGLDNSKYDIIALLDADDTWNEMHLISAIQSIEKKQADGAFSVVNLVKNSNIIYKSPIWKSKNICDYLYLDNGIAVTSSLVILRDSALNIRFDEEQFKHQDWDFLIRFSLSYKICQSDYEGLNYQIDTNGSMSSKYNIDASFRFIKKTLPKEYHVLFIKALIIGIITKKDKDNYIKIRQEIKRAGQENNVSFGLINLFLIKITDVIGLKVTSVIFNFIIKLKASLNFYL